MGDRLGILGAVDFWLFDIYQHSISFLHHIPFVGFLWTWKIYTRSQLMRDDPLLPWCTVWRRWKIIPPPKTWKIIKLVCALLSLPACYNIYTMLDTIHVLVQGVSHPWHASITRRLSLSLCVVYTWMTKHCNGKLGDHIYAVSIQMAIIRHIKCLRPYHVENASSRPITEAKQRRAQLVLGWVTAWEYWVL